MTGTAIDGAAYAADLKHLTAGMVADVQRIVVHVSLAMT